MNRSHVKQVQAGQPLNRGWCNTTLEGWNRNKYHSSTGFQEEDLFIE